MVEGRWHVNYTSDHFNLLVYSLDGNVSRKTFANNSEQKSVIFRPPVIYSRRWNRGHADRMVRINGISEDHNGDTDDAILYSSSPITFCRKNIYQRDRSLR